MVTALALHPAQRRRQMTLVPAEPPHDVVLRPLAGAGPNGAIVSADEQSFVDAILADLERSDWRQAIGARRGRRRGTDGVLELSQPIHRRQHLVLVEAFCREVGSPRLDPAKLDGTGFVLRRIGPSGYQGWLTQGPRKLGWRTLPRPDLDPDPDRRIAQRPGAAGQIDALILARRPEAKLAEEIIPLFPAPPELCEKLGRTILFGVVPVTSSDRSDEPVPAPDYTTLPADEAQAMRDHLSEYLKQRPRLSMPRAGQTLAPGWNPLAITVVPGTEDARLNAFGVFLQQLLVELDAFGSGPAAAALLAELNRITLPMQRDGQGRVIRTMQAGAFLAAAAPILISGEANSRSLTMPLDWPALDAAQGQRLTQLSLACLAQRFVALTPPTPKFDGATPRYAIRPFIRVRGHDDCPSRLVWADYSETFRILPWWDGDGPATKIPLPNPLDFRKMKPNVSFEVPSPLANLLRGDAKKLSEGEGSTSGLDIAWLCSFSIPIITICAFIVLGIFLSLFNLIFSWMAFIKICIPIPKPK